MTTVTNTETLGEIAQRILAPTIGKVAPAVYRELVSETVEALRNERERAAKSLDERVRQCDEHITLNDQQGREFGYGCWRDIANALRHAAVAIREGR